MLNIIKRDLLLFVRDKSNLFFLVVFPTMMVFLFGTIMQNISNFDSAITEMKVEYSVSNLSAETALAIEAFITELNNTEGIIFTEAALDESRRRTDEGEASAAVSFNGNEIEIYKGRDDILNRAAESIIRGFSRRMAAGSLLAYHAPESAGVSQNTAASGVTQKEFGYKRSMLDYYAVSIIVLMIFMGGSMSGASAMRDGRMDGTLTRMLASPKIRAAMYIQSVLGSLPQCVSLAAFVMLPSVLLFNARYAATAADNLLLLITMVTAAMAVNAVTMIIGMFIKVNPMIVIMPVMWAMLFLSGIFVPGIYVEGVSGLMPAWQLQNAAFDLTVFGRPEKCLTVCLAGAAVLAASTVIGAALFNRKGMTGK